MKKSIASSFLIDTSINTGKNDTEQLIFGKCGISYEIKNSGSTKIIEKTINHDTCVERSMKQSSNVDWVKNNHSPFQHKTKRIYLVSKNNCLFSIDSSSNFTLQTSPDVRSTNHLEQNQYFELIATKENTKPLKIHNNTIIKNLKYEDPSTKNIQTNQNVYLEDFINAYTKFKSQIEQKPLRFLDPTTSSPLSEMLSNLKKFDEICLRKLLLGILMGKDTQCYEVFLEILPYAGTKHTTSLIKEIIKDKVSFHTKMKLLTTFTEYIQEIDAETLNNFEELLTYKFEEIQIKHTAILSFASLISKGIERNTIDDGIADKYMKKFYDKFSNAQTYDDKVIYLLALVNISNKVPLNAILNIIYNNKESRHIRELAMYGFTNRLKQFGEELFNKFWEIVTNPNANIETRIAALDLLLNCKITEEQFKEIVNFTDKKLNNPFDEHISNYIVTTIISLQNNTGYQHYLGDWATNIFQTKKPRQNLKAWSSGNYRFSFTDNRENFGLALQTRLVADPKTNAINVIQFNFNKFAMSMNLGEFHVYIKLEGILDLFFEKAFLATKSDTASIDELINIIQQYEYQVKNRNELFIDVVVFNEKRALFALFINENNHSTVKSTILESMLKFIAYHKIISFPILNEIEFPSDLGTEIKIAYHMEQVLYHEYKNFLELIQSNTTAKIEINNKILVQMTETIISNNPLKDVKINVEKLHHEFKTIDLPVTIDKNNLSISWTFKNDAFNSIKQNNIYAFVSNSTTLKEHCINCNQIEEIPIQASMQECLKNKLYTCVKDEFTWKEKIINYNLLGLNFNMTSFSKGYDISRTNQLNKEKLTNIINSHKGNALTYPFVKPILYYLHIDLYNRYLDEDLQKYSVKNNEIYSYGKAYTTKLKHISWFNEKSMKKYHPINNFNDNFTFEIINTVNKNDDILSGAGVTFLLASAMTVNNNQFESKFDIVANVLEPDNTKKKFCFNYTMVYPNRLSNKIFIEFVKPAKGVTTISWNEVESYDECSPYFLKLTEELSINEEYNQVLKNMDEYKTCKKESVNFKYAPQTESCKIVHNAASLYRDYVVYVQTQKGGLLHRPHNKDKIFEYHHVDGKTIRVSIERDFIHLFGIYPKPEYLNYEEPSTYAHYISTNPTDFVTNYETSCNITSHTMKTFFDLNIKFDKKPMENITAFVECTNSSQVGLVVSKAGEMNVVFIFWSGPHKIVTNIENNKIKIKLDENEIKENTKNDELNIYFIDKDSVIIQNDVIELYYTPVSLNINIPYKFYYTYLCGYCMN